MTIVSTPGHPAVVFAGQDGERAELVGQVREMLLAAGHHPLEVDDVLADRQGLVVAAWWGGDALGFVGSEHPDAQPVTAVNLPGQMDLAIVLPGEA